MLYYYGLWTMDYGLALNHRKVTTYPNSTSHLRTQSCKTTRAKSATS